MHPLPRIMDCHLLQVMHSYPATRDRGLSSNPCQAIGLTPYQWRKVRRILRTVQCLNACRCLLVEKSTSCVPRLRGGTKARSDKRLHICLNLSHCSHLVAKLMCSSCQVKKSVYVGVRTKFNWQDLMYDCVVSSLSRQHVSDNTGSVWLRH